jgi:hypothetical protein
MRRVSSLEAKLGRVILPASFTSLNINSIVSRSSPTIAGNLLISGLYWYGVVMAVKRTTRELAWIPRVEAHFTSVITMFATYYKRLVNLTLALSMFFLPFQIVLGENTLLWMRFFYYY